MASRNIADFLNADSNLARLSAHAGKLLNLQRIFERAAPAALAQHGRVANMKLGKVVIHATNSAVAAKIRQLTPRLTESFRQSGVDVNEIQVKVQPGIASDSGRKQESPADIGIATKQGLTSLAQSLPQESPLRTALERFALRARIRTTRR
ncbi:DciA family protein [Georgfuchsia toluolica]|nr:DciA family protein [Georgfuchsia toluolica]